MSNFLLKVRASMKLLLNTMRHSNIRLLLHNIYSVKRTTFNYPFYTISAYWCNIISCGIYYLLSQSYQNICNLMASVFVVSVQGAQYDNTALQWKYEKKIQNVWFTKPAWKSAETTCSRLSHGNTFDFKWKINLGNIPAVSETETPCTDIIYADKPREIRNHRNKTSGTSMERFENASHDDVQKLPDKSKNKNTTFPQTKIHYVLVAIWKSSCRTCPRAIWHVFLVSHVYGIFFSFHIFWHLLSLA